MVYHLLGYFFDFQPASGTGVDLLRIVLSERSTSAIVISNDLKKRTMDKSCGHFNCSYLSNYLVAGGW